MWQKEEDRQEMLRAKESAVTVEAERIYRERIEEIRQKARKELDSPPDVLTPAEERKETGKKRCCLRCSSICDRSFTEH